MNLQLQWDLFHAQRTEAEELQRIRKIRLPVEA
jgi:hydroxypyruvate isomerase